MALNMKRGVLLLPTQFKRLGQEQYRMEPSGTLVRYSRSPVNPGLFVVWHGAGMKWFFQVDAINLLRVVQPFTTLHLAISAQSNQQAIALDAEQGGGGKMKYTVRLIYKEIIDVTDVEADSEEDAKKRAVDLLEENGGQVDYFLYDAEIRRK